jgi:hypothetical protein
MYSCRSLLKIIVTFVLPTKNTIFTAFYEIVNYIQKQDTKDLSRNLSAHVSNFKTWVKWLWHRSPLSLAHIGGFVCKNHQEVLEGGSQGVISKSWLFGHSNISAELSMFYYSFYLWWCLSYTKINLEVVLGSWIPNFELYISSVTPLSSTVGMWSIFRLAFFIAVLAKDILQNL